MYILTKYGSKERDFAMKADLPSRCHRSYVNISVHISSVSPGSKKCRMCIFLASLACYGNRFSRSTINTKLENENAGQACKFLFSSNLILNHLFFHCKKHHYD